MTLLSLRTMKQQDWSEVADLIYVSTNYWYRTNGKSAIFAGDPTCTELFCSVYEALDPGCCLVAENSATGRIAGSCFYHPRPTHVSLGIMNVHPNYFGMGVARQLLQAIVEIAESQNKPLRLVSSAMNLDSFSLYTRAGFVPRTVYQDMVLPLPENGLAANSPEARRVRPATFTDWEAITALEEELNHIRRDKDYRYFLSNEAGIWHTSVLEGEKGSIDGFLVSVAHPGSTMLGPGIARTETQALALLCTELNHHRGKQPVFLVPVACETLVRELYRLGAKNCELHFAQVRGSWTSPIGVVMPSFIPETG